MRVAYNNFNTNIKNCVRDFYKLRNKVNNKSYVHW